MAKKKSVKKKSVKKISDKENIANDIIPLSWFQNGKRVSVTFSSEEARTRYIEQLEQNSDVTDISYE